MVRNQQIILTFAEEFGRHIGLLLQFFLALVEKVVKFFEFDRLVFVFGLEVAEKFDVILNKTGFDWFEYSDPMMMVAVELFEMVELMEIVDKQLDLIVVAVDI